MAQLRSRTLFEGKINHQFLCCCSFSSLGSWGERSMWGEGCFILVHHLRSSQYSPINGRRVGCCTPASTRQHFKLHPSIHPSSVHQSARPPHRPGFTSPLHVRWELQARSVARQRLHKLSLRNLSHGWLAPRAHAMEVKVSVKAPLGSSGRWDPVSY